MAWKAEVITDDEGWVGNRLVFATQAEAQRYVHDLMMRWTAVRDTRTVETDASVTNFISAEGVVSEVA
mgnify:CR=1 FL=1